MLSTGIPIRSSYWKLTVSLARILAVMMSAAGLLQDATSAHAQSRPTIDVQQRAFGTLSLRATPGKERIESPRYWLYVDRKIVKIVGSGSSGSIAFLPIDQQLASDDHAIALVWYGTTTGHLNIPPSFAWLNGGTYQSKLGRGPMS